MYINLLTYLINLLLDLNYLAISQCQSSPYDYVNLSYSSLMEDGQIVSQGIDRQKIREKKRLRERYRVCLCVFLVLKAQIQLPKVTCQRRRQLNGHSSNELVSLTSQFSTLISSTKPQQQLLSLARLFNKYKL